MSSAKRRFWIRNGKVCSIPPTAVATPVMAPRSQGPPRPVIEPSSESASASPMLIPAPSEAARPTKKALSGRPVIPAAAKIGASVETAPSISPSRAGCTFCRTKARSSAPVLSVVNSALVIRRSGLGVTTLNPRRGRRFPVRTWRRRLALRRAGEVHPEPLAQVGGRAASDAADQEAGLRLVDLAGQGLHHVLALGDERLDVAVVDHHDADAGEVEIDQLRPDVADRDGAEPERVLEAYRDARQLGRVGARRHAQEVDDERADDPGRQG